MTGMNMPGSNGFCGFQHGPTDHESHESHESHGQPDFPVPGRIRVIRVIRGRMAVTV